MSSKAYRDHAEQCLRLARKITSPANRAFLVTMAGEWLALAQRAESGATHGTSEDAGEDAEDVPRVRRRMAAC
jgi:hypothetical protein